jgi:hypothetical protein
MKAVNYCLFYIDVDFYFSKMTKCVYCLKTEVDTTFYNEEHIISQSLGGKPFPVITGDLVCDQCNRDFGKLETDFKQDTLEGVNAQMYGFCDSVWVGGKYFTMSDIGIFEDGLLNGIFPFLKIEDGKEVIEFKSQLKVQNKNKGFQVFPIDYLIKVKNGPKRDFEKLKERLSKTSPKDLRIFAGDEGPDSDAIDRCISLLKDFGITYTEKERAYEPNEDKINKETRIDYRAQVNKPLMRVIAKIAFNYFIYCTGQEGELYKRSLFKNTFDEIRNFIYKAQGDWKKIVTVLLDEQGILNIEESRDKRVVAHTIYFTLKNNCIIARISLFGKWIYEVRIGEYPLHTIAPMNFGCGHVFDPFSKKIHAITSDRYSINRRMDEGFGWFKV